MFNKILISNRGEIALRIIKCCKKLKIKTVSIYSDVDKNLIYLSNSDESIYINENKFENGYLNIENIINIAKYKKVDAIHPGYGFLSENAYFAEQVNNSGIKFIGPSASAIRKMGNKLNAINIIKNYNINYLPFYKCSNDIKKNVYMAKKIGYPIILKGSNSGGGKGLNVVKCEKDLNKLIKKSLIETNALFKKNFIYMEKYLYNSRHIEIQILRDNKKNIIFLGERECSIQMGYQKLIEETPIKNINYNKLENIKKECIKICNEINYSNAGTFEFLYSNDKFYFIEMNTRLQVEHTVTEMVTKIDIVEKQIEISYNNIINIKQEEINIDGHAIECRINTRDSIKPILKQTKIKILNFPNGPGIRFDSHIYNGYIMPTKYDSLIGKLIVWGKNRKDAINKLRYTINELNIENIKTNISLLKNIINDENYINNNINTNYINKFLK